MSFRVLKHPLRSAPVQEVLLRSAAKILCVKVQGAHGGGLPHLWALEDDARRLVRHTVCLVATGVVFGEEEVRRLRYLDTVLIEDGALVLHVFLRSCDACRGTGVSGPLNPDPCPKCAAEEPRG